MYNLDDDILLAGQISFNLKREEDGTLILTVNQPFILSGIEYEKGQRISEAEYHHMGRTVIDMERVVGVVRQKTNSISQRNPNVHQEAD